MALPDRPTIDELRKYLGNTGGAPIDSETLQNALDAAKSRVMERCVSFDDPATPEVEVELPVEVIQGITMFAARLYRRRFSTGGYEGFGDVGIARVPSLDPDIEDMLIRYLRYDFA